MTRAPHAATSSIRAFTVGLAWAGMTILVLSALVSGVSTLLEGKGAVAAALAASAQAAGILPALLILFLMRTPDAPAGRADPR
jgi:hypothetical protein